MEPRELLKKLHPNQFSDSKIVDKVECPRELLDFSLSRLAEQNKHFDFEEFVRKLLEREVCPNLIEETGPAGGGDGKVDTENYPVAQSVQAFWWYGQNTDNERWAFAFSLKKDWKSKCNSDIKKIIETQRGYTKIFFVTNQAIKNNLRLEYQDSKKKETDIDITIFDKTWILDKALSDKNLDLLKILNIVTPLKEKEVGPNDIKKQKRLEDVEKQLNEYSYSNVINQDVLDLANEAAILSRDLEEKEDVVAGKFDRALRLSRKKGNITFEKTILYNLAWYYHWWLDDNENFERYYTEYESRVIKDKFLEEILSLADLWTLAFTRNKRNQDIMENRTKTLMSLLHEKENSQSRVTQLEAKTRLCILKILLEEDIDYQFESLITIIDEATMFKEYNFLTLAKMIENLLPVFNENEKYNHLYDLITDKLTTRKGEVQRAKMYLKKAKVLSSNSDHYAAINLLGKCLTLLYKNETDDKLLEVYVNIGGSFDSIGLYYAAKNYYIAAITLFMDMFLKENILDSFCIKILNRVLDIEISMGNVEAAIEWVNIKNIFISILIEKNESINIEEEDEFLLQRDALLASTVLSTKISNFNLMDKIISQSARNGLFTTEIMAKYVIGHYDDQLLKENSVTEIDSLIKEFYENALNQKLSTPFYMDLKEKEITSSLNGNKVIIRFTSSKLLYRFSEFIIALFENAFATMFSYKTFMRGDIILLIKETNTGNFDISYSFDGIDTYTISLDSIELYDATVDNHKVITDTLYNLLINVLAVSFIYKDFESTMEEMFVNDKTFERVLNHTNCLYNLNRIFGNEEDEDYTYFEVKRVNEWYSEDNINFPVEETEDPFEDIENIIYGKPTDDNLEKKCFKNISHSNIYTSGIIKCNHWDSAGWKGVMYLGDLDSKKHLKIGFLFENENGAKKVFQDLIDNASRNDATGKIIISFIKGINKDKKYDYRVLITGRVDIPKGNKENIVINSIARFHEMNCRDGANIKILEDVIYEGVNPSIHIFPAIIGVDRRIKPLWDLEIKIRKINIKQAYEISKGDIEAAAILKDDKPIIPSDIKDAPVIELLRLKNS